jgi:hypothetical protein
MKRWDFEIGGYIFAAALIIGVPAVIVYQLLVWAGML